ncbi:MAG: hypothetical protein M3132_04275 [Actinomycetia bacterium]|nr:hypothetical protein [Actinomycetes bacterium]
MTAAALARREHDGSLSMPFPDRKRSQPSDGTWASLVLEDRVTWNLLQALRGTQGSGWWAVVVAAAEADAGRRVTD